jgi:hypothetical protein
MASPCCVEHGEMRWINYSLLALIIVGCAKTETLITPCPSLVQGCAVALGRNKILVKTNTAPVSLQPFSLSISGSSARAVTVTLQMQGMDMGSNRYHLLRQSDGEWRGTLTLPVCVSGRSDWLMMLDFDGERRALVFQTQSN